MSAKRTVKDYAFLVLKGMGMGAADVVPGVSGGTIAFISGIYEELINSINGISPKLIPLWKEEGFASLWKKINGPFLIAVFGGIFISIFSLAKALSWLLENHPILVWSFFFGLIIASVILLARHMPHWRWKDYLATILGAALVAAIYMAAPAQLPGHWWVMFLGGFIAICAMILPGISGSFLLLLGGLYPVFLDAVNDLEWLLLISFGGGAICGLLVFSRFLSWLLHAYHQVTVATLIGFLVGSPRTS